MAKEIDVSMLAGRRYEVIGARRGRVVLDGWPEPGVRQVLVRVHANGLCASDLPAWAAGPADGRPLRLGHEPIGEIVAVGPASVYEAGRWVVGRIAPSLAEYAIASEEDLVPVPPGLDPDNVLGEPLGCVVNALERTRIPLGGAVAVIGLGFMGLVMVQLLRATGVGRIIALDPREDARAAATANGADETHHPERLPARLLHHGGELDAVVEASGTQPGLDLATSVVREHGTLSILGYHQGHRNVDMKTWNWKSIDVINGHVRDQASLRASTAAGLALQAASRIDIGTLITHRFELTRTDDGFAALLDKPGGFVKAVVVMR